MTIKVSVDVIGLLLLVVITGCSYDIPRPERCRAVGVTVPDNAPISGEIVREKVGTLDAVRKHCQNYLIQDKYGCSIPIGEHQYVLWFVDDPKYQDHERCHALYEVGHK